VTVLAAEGLVKRYKARRVVDGVSVRVATGEVVGLLGPNGAGKSTSFYMIIGLVKADGGSVFIGDRDVSRRPMHVRARLGLGYLPQEPSVFRKLSVADNIMAVLQTRRELNAKEREQEVERLLDELNVSGVRDSLGMSLSGGERRRVEIARALAMDPEFILLDEPFAGVDPLALADIQSIVRHLCERGIGVLITDHNVRETLGICHRAYIVSEGKVIAEGSSDEVLRHEEVREVYLGHDFHL